MGQELCHVCFCCWIAMRCKVKRLWSAPLLLLLTLANMPGGAPAYAGFGTTVPVSAETATNIARSLFPVSLDVGPGKLFLTDPVVIYLDDKRVGLQANLQAYEHRPEEGVAISEEGEVTVSGELGYDLKTRQVLLYSPRLDNLSFDKPGDVTRRLRAEVQAAWDSQVTNPIRAAVPPHPFIQPFKEGIQDISYSKQSIFIQVWYP